MLRTIIEEVSARKDGPKKKQARVLVYGCEIDHIAFMPFGYKEGICTRGTGNPKIVY
jgi:hypothetical protein